MNKEQIAWLVWVMVLMLGASSCFKMQRLPDEPSQAVESRQLADNTVGLQEYWRVSRNCLSADPYYNPSVIGASGRVICPHYNSESAKPLQVFDALSGELLWEVPTEPGSRELAADAERVYIMNSFEIRAYDLSSGQHLWTSERLPGHRAYYLHSDKNGLHVRDLTYGIIYHLDAGTGDILDSVSLLAGDGVRSLAQFPQFYLYTSRTALQAVDKTTRQPLWTLKGDVGPIVRLPELVDDVLLIGLWEQVLAVDIRTGQVKWRNREPSGRDIPFASNFIVANGYLYALDYNARLVQLDIEAGKEMGFLQFAPARTNVSERRYGVAADGQMIFVSFGDSQELIALGP